MDARPIDRVASPVAFAQLLDALPLDIALPYALAGYGMGRRAQVIRLRWPEVDLDVGAIERGVEWGARRYDASHRVVPTVAPLLGLLKRRYMAQGRPKEGRVCAPTFLGAFRLAQQRVARHSRARIRRKRSFSRSRCKRPATRPRLGSMPPACRLKLPRFSEPSPRQSVSQEPRRSRSRGTRKRSQRTSGERGNCSAPTWASASTSGGAPGDGTPFRFPFPPKRIVIFPGRVRIVAPVSKTGCRDFPTRGFESLPLR
jgi:hypothetical protein